jgi:hypothetical protein
MTTAVLPVLVDYTQSPNGVLHLIDPHPDVFDTYCWLNVRTKPGDEGWIIGGESVSGAAATCLPCRIAYDKRMAGSDEHGNFTAENGVDRCPCGTKYWENDQCIDCEGTWHPECRDAD